MINLWRLLWKKTVEMNIETEEAVRSNKRGREDQEDYGTYDEGRRQSKRIKRSKVTNDVILAK